MFCEKWKKKSIHCTTGLATLLLSGLMYIFCPISTLREREKSLYFSLFSTVRKVFGFEKIMVWEINAQMGVKAKHVR